MTAYRKILLIVAVVASFASCRNDLREDQSKTDLREHQKVTFHDLEGCWMLGDSYDRKVHIDDIDFPPIYELPKKVEVTTELVHENSDGYIGDWEVLIPEFTENRYTSLISQDDGIYCGSPHKMVVFKHQGGEWVLTLSMVTSYTKVKKRIYTHVATYRKIQTEQVVALDG